MFKVFIVDDEIWVCELIRRAIKWDQLDMEVIGEANDGITAYNMLVEYQPDIVITDIRMPGIDGISLIKKAKEANIHSKFIIMSGYQDFEYAQSALKLGVEDYFLKPIYQEELTNTLMRLRERFYINNEQVQNEENLRKLLASSIDKLKEQFMYKLLFDNEQKPINLEEINAEYHFKFKSGFYNVLIFKINYIDDTINNKNLEDTVFRKALEIIKGRLGSKCYEIFTLQHKNDIICILNFPQDQSLVIENVYKKVYQEVKTYIDLYHFFVLAAGVGTAVKELSQLKQSLDRGYDSIKCRILMGNERIIDISKVSFNSYKITDIITVEKEKQFICLIEIFDTNELTKWLKELFVSISDKRDINPCLVFEVCHEIVEMFFRTMKKYDLFLEQEYISKNKVNEDLDECNTLNELLDYLLKLVNESLSFYYNSKQSQNYRPVELVKSYISKHYSEQIGLVDAANLVYLNPAYFSDIFKKETGVNFSDYLLNYRIEIAKQLLKDIQYRANDVSEMVGYKDPKYFSKLFKKVVGISPAQYKKLYT